MSIEDESIDEPCHVNGLEHNRNPKERSRRGQEGRRDNEGNASQNHKAQDNERTTGTLIVPKENRPKLVEQHVDNVEHDTDPQLPRIRKSDLSVVKDCRGTGCIQDGPHNGKTPPGRGPIWSILCVPLTTGTCIVRSKLGKGKSTPGHYGRSFLESKHFF